MCVVFLLSLKVRETPQAKNPVSSTWTNFWDMGQRGNCLIAGIFPQASQIMPMVRTRCQKHLDRITRGGDEEGGRTKILPFTPHPHIWFVISCSLLVWTLLVFPRKNYLIYLQNLQDGQSILPAAHIDNVGAGVGVVSPVASLARPFTLELKELKGKDGNHN